MVMCRTGRRKAQVRPASSVTVHGNHRTVLIDIVIQTLPMASRCSNIHKSNRLDYDSKKHQNGVEWFSITWSRHAVHWPYVLPFAADAVASRFYHCPLVLNSTWNLEKREAADLWDLPYAYAMEIAYFSPELDFYLISKFVISTNLLCIVSAYVTTWLLPCFVTD